VTCFHLLTKSKVDQLFERQGYDWINNWQQHLKFSLSQESVHVLNRLLQPEERYRYQTANQVLRDLPTNASTLPTNPVSPHQSTPLPTYSSVQLTIAAMPLFQPLAAKQQSLVRPSQVGWSFFFKWIIASFIGVTVGAIVMSLLLGLALGPNLKPLTEDWASHRIVLGFLNQPAMGIGEGVAQWLVMRNWIPGTGWWVAARTLNYFLNGTALAFGGSGVLGGMITGTISGLAQWSVIKRKASRSVWWIFYCVVEGIGVSVATGTENLGEIVNGFQLTYGSLIQATTAAVIPAVLMTWILRSATPRSAP